MHLGRRLRFGRELEHDRHTVDSVRLGLVPDGPRRCDPGEAAERDGLARAGVDLRRRALGQQRPERVQAAARHLHAGQQVLEQAVEGVQPRLAPQLGLTVSGGSASSRKR